MKEKAITTASRVIDTMMRRYDAPKLPPEKTFLYHQGVFLSGVLKISEQSENEKYYEYVKAWVDSIVDADGKFIMYDESNDEVIQPGLDKRSIDHIQPGILLFPLFRKTGDDRYKIALEYLMEILKTWKKNKSGGFWHKECHPDQMWLDSLYMGGPIRAEYAHFSNEMSWLDEASAQAIIMYDNMYDEKSGLLLHAWDESKKEGWADKETGLSEEVWGRALGWYVYALLDILDFMDESHKNYKRLLEIEKSLLAKLIDYRDEKTKMWYQVVDKGQREDNWIETSCSCLFTAAIAKAVKKGVLDEHYKAYANECFESIIASLTKEGEDLCVGGVCVGTSVCNYKEYIERPTCTNDLHGVGAFLLMCAAAADIN